MTAVMKGPRVMPVTGTDTGQAPATVRPAGPGDLGELGRMVGRCSAAAVRDRTHGGTRHADLLDGIRSTLLGGSGTVLLAAEGRRAVGCLELLRPSPGAPVAEMALLVEDARQGTGIGTRLVAAVPGWARAAGVRDVHFSVEAGNGRARRLLRRLDAGRLRVRWEQGVVEGTWHVGGL
ncbi:GNAT family N-acetyltransferase [Streptomyces naganishii]|uniref:GNAT family N-acetyltransferase n=1 Tax=Streptomyces naganishii TaxID=285447 RepID=UPI0036C7FAF2